MSRIADGSSTDAAPGDGDQEPDVPHEATPPSLVTGSIRRALRLGEIIGEFTYHVSAGDVERFVVGSSDEGERWRLPTRYVGGHLPAGTPAPPMFFIALDPFERGDLDVEGYLADIPYLPTGGGNAFSEVTYERPIRVGDVVTVSTVYTDVYEKEGRAGRLLFRIRENTYAGEAGEPIARSRCGHVRAYDMTRWKDGSRAG